MNDLLTDRHSDELTESEAAALFGGGPADPAAHTEVCDMLEREDDFESAHSANP